MNQAMTKVTPACNQSQVTDFELLSRARIIIRQEAEALSRFQGEIPLSFADAVRMIKECNGSVIVTGIGKAGWIGQKISASFASTGTRSHFLHAAEAFHGDLGRVDGQDIVLVLSNSGETEEVVKTLPALRKSGASLIAITGSEQSTLGKYCNCTIAYGSISEACQNNLAPSTSTTLMLAIGDALALTVSNLYGFSALDFARFHPGGSLGRKLQTVDEVMRPLAECRTTLPNSTVRESISTQARQGRRTGALLVLGPENRLEGIFTDSDLVRLLEKKQDQLLDQPIDQLMTTSPYQITFGSMVSEAVEILSANFISELPVVNSEGFAVGLIDITDVIA